MTTQPLIDSLVGDMKPVRRLNVVALLGAIVPAVIMAVFLVTLAGGLKEDLARLGNNTDFWVLVAICLAMSFGCLAVAVRLARPGARPPVWAWPLVIAGLLAFIVPPALMLIEDKASPLLHAFDLGGPRCFRLVLLASILPSLAMLRWARMGAVTRPVLFAGTTALASANLGNIAMMLTCGMIEMRHILMSHGPAMLIVGCVVGGITFVLARRW